MITRLQKEVHSPAIQVQCSQGQPSALDSLGGTVGYVAWLHLPRQAVFFLGGAGGLGEMRLWIAIAVYQYGRGFATDYVIRRYNQRGYSYIRTERIGRGKGHWIRLTIKKKHRKEENTMRLS